MADRNSSIMGNQIIDNTIKQDELDSTNIPTDKQILQINILSSNIVLRRNKKG